MIPLIDSTQYLGFFPVMTLTIFALTFFVFITELMGGAPFITRWSLVTAHIAAELKG